MKYGEVTRIRLSPENVMGCIDVCKTSGVYVEGMSLAQVVSLALAGLLDGHRAIGMIPTRDGFEYSEMVLPILAQGRTARKMQITATVERAALERNTEPREPQLPENILRKKGRVMSKLLELEQKRDVDPDNFTAEDIERLLKLNTGLINLNNGQDIDVSRLL